jgi:DNA-binding LytR/AlgR family response regulator
MPTALLVDDEPNLSRHLGRMLERTWPALEVIGTAGNGVDALALAANHHPDVVFLDIHMPGMNGLQVAERLPPGTRVVFITAYDEYAVQAFEAAAVDYLLKPVSEQRLAATVQRLQAAAAAVPPAQVTESLQAALQAASQRNLKWIRAGRGEAVQLIPVSAVVYFKADNKYTAVITATQEHLIRTSISELEERLDPERFWRIHRGLIVAVEEIAEARRDLRGRYNLSLRSRPETLRVSQGYAHRFKQM